MGMSKKYKDLSKNTLLFTISSFGAKLISFLLVPLYTYVLSTNDYGNVDVIATTVQLLIPVLTLNIQDSVLRFSLDEDYDEDEVLGAGLKVIAISGVVLGLALAVVHFCGLFNLDAQYYYYLFLSYFFGVVFNCFSMYLKAKNRVPILVICGLVNTFLTCALNLVLLLVVRFGITGFLISNVAGTVVAVLIAFFAGGIWKEVKYSNTRSLVRKMIPYSAPLVINSVAWWLNNASDRYILTFFCGAAVNGIYAVAYKIPTVLATVQSVFYNAWSISAITEFDKDDTDGFIGNIYSLYSAASYVVCSFLLLGNIIIAKLLYKGEFFAAWQYVPPLLVGTVFNGMALFEGCIFTAVKRTKDVSKTTIAGAIVNTILNFLLIPFVGALGAAYATMIGYVSIWAVRTAKLRDIVNMKVDWPCHFITMGLIVVQASLALFRGFYWTQLPIVALILFLQRGHFLKVLSVLIRKVKKGN